MSLDGVSGIGRPQYQSLLGANSIASYANAVGNRYIIMLRDQHASLPDTRTDAAARRLTTGADQRPILSLLSQAHSRFVRSLTLMNGVVATMSPAQAAQMAANTSVAEVIPDQKFKLSDPATGAGLEAVLKAAGIPVSTSASTAVAASVPAPAGSDQLCPTTPGTPLLEPEALQLLHVENQPGDLAPAAHDFADGSGVTVAFLGDGQDINNPDFQRPDGQPVFVDYKDFGGDGIDAPTSGEEGFIDASAIAAQGNQVYDISKYGNAPLPAGCDIRVKGVAPGASLVGLKYTTDGGNFGTTSSIIEGIDYAISHDHVDVIDESLAGAPFPDLANDALKIVNGEAVAAGVTIVAASSDAGPTNTIGSPASDPQIISVGASTATRSWAQTNLADSKQLGSGGYVSDNVSTLSSGGFGQIGPRTVDVLAPGDEDWSLCSTDWDMYASCAWTSPQPADAPGVFPIGGTSQSAPYVAGVAALIIQAYARTHGGAKPSPALIKQIIMSTADDLDIPADLQGAGIANALRAVQEAMSMTGPGQRRSSASPVGDGLLVSPGSIALTGEANSTDHLSLTVTNTGSVRQLLAPHLANPGAVIKDDSGTLALDAFNDPTVPDNFGDELAYVTHPVEVPPGTQQLDMLASWDRVGIGSVVLVTLFDPDGRLVQLAEPLFTPNTDIDQLEVRLPEAGMWRAVIWTIGGDLAQFGYTGPVKFDFQMRALASTPAAAGGPIRLDPGQTVHIPVSLSLPGKAGDTADSLELGNSADTALPVTMRSLVTLSRQTGGSFSAVLTGGNGAPVPAESKTFQFDVPHGAPALDISVALRDEGYDLTALLVDPQGDTRDVQTTAAIDSAGNEELTSTLSLMQDDPDPGRWSLLLYTTGPNANTSLREPLTGQIGFDQARVTSTGIPVSSSVHLAIGHPLTAAIHVTNASDATKSFFADPRLNTTGDVELLGLTPTSGVALPNSPVEWLVPTHSTRLTGAAVGTVPINADLGTLYGDPDIFGFNPAPTVTVATVRGAELGGVPWLMYIQQAGPFPATGAPPGTADAGLIAHTRLFDNEVTTSTGDIWAQTVDPAAAYAPLVLAPGESGTIEITFDAAAPAVTYVRGSIDIDTFNDLTGAGDAIATIPYAYMTG